MDDFKLDNNEVEIAAMKAFSEGNMEKGTKLQEEFINRFNEMIENRKDYCPCKAPCNIHGNCRLCVAIHRAHGDHLPACMRNMVNKRLVELCKLTENTIKNELPELKYDPN